MQTIGDGLGILKVREIQRTYSYEQIKAIFKFRRKDDMFLEIGRIYAKPTDETETDLIWRGYEILTESPYLEV